MTGIADRFSGAAGRANRIEAIRGQSLVAGDADLAEMMADMAEICVVEPGEQLIAQDGSDDDLYLIFGGSFKVIVGARRIATRGRGDHVGEMALIEPTQPRSASVIAEDLSVVAKFTATDMEAVGQRFPEIYRHIAKSLSRRLRERNKFVGQFRERTKVFLISSVESLPIARIIQNSFEHDDFLTTLWTDGVFRAANYTLEALEEQLDDSDVAIAIAHGDDLTQFRGQDWPSPRDNVVFELGMFMGKLGRSRAILMEPREEKVRLPSDLSGITTIAYRYEAGKDSAALMAPACNRLRAHILDLGPFNG